MSVARVMDQTSCERAGKHRGRSNACALCSGYDEDRGDVPRSTTSVRIERCCSPPAMQRRASGPPGGGSKPKDDLDGVLFVTAAMATISETQGSRSTDSESL
eukprot:3921868-Prymnesium_polylepis.1